VFAVVVERTVKQDRGNKLHYEYGYRVEVRQTANDFIDLFARLVVRHGKRPAKTYARLLGTDEALLKATLRLLSGTDVRGWTDALARAVAETLLRETYLPVGRIAAAVGWSVGIFSHWFRRQYKRAPLDWRYMNRRAG
jgi:AraC-like DNA-binding protein